jgi:hypothetical protein
LLRYLHSELMRACDHRLGPALIDKALADIERLTSQFQRRRDE